MRIKTYKDIEMLSTSGKVVISYQSDFKLVRLESWNILPVAQLYKNVMYIEIIGEKPPLRKPVIS
jgi:hypothetical protein